MSIHAFVPTPRRQVGGPVSALLQLVRHRGQRIKNLTELKALDARRLQDIGLTEYTRARILHPH